MLEVLSRYEFWRILVDHIDFQVENIVPVRLPGLFVESLCSLKIVNYFQREICCTRNGLFFQAQ